MSHEVVIRLHDQERLWRKLKLAFAASPDPERAVKFILDRFMSDLREYPYQWPVQDEPPTEHEWRFGQTVVRYRRVPADHLVVILDVVDPGACSRDATRGS
jgi:hypothetical protein